MSIINKILVLLTKRKKRREEKNDGRSAELFFVTYWRTIADALAEHLFLFQGNEPIFLGFVGVSHSLLTLIYILYLIANDAHNWHSVDLKTRSRTIDNRYSFVFIQCMQFWDKSISNWAIWGLVLCSDSKNSGNACFFLYVFVFQILCSNFTIQSTWRKKWGTFILSI